MKQKQILFSKYTNEGGRKVNEDSVGVFTKEGMLCAVLCDGLGGHGMGEVASSIAVNSFKKVLEEETAASVVLSKGFDAAQQNVMKEQIIRNATLKMKTTGVAAVIDAKTVNIAHIGDSRLYIFKRNKVKMRTKDHSVPQMLVASGQIKENEIRNHPDRNKVLRVIGVDWDGNQMYETEKPIPRRKCDAILLCSDGFWELIEENEMCRLLKTCQTPEEWIQKMAEVVNKNGVGKNMDNNSAIAIWL